MLELDIEGRAGQFALGARISAGIGTTALIGPSGAGKTTLLRMIAGLAGPDRGTISLDGKVWFDAAAPTEIPAHKRGVGMVFQEPRLLPHRSVAGNIAVGLRGGLRSRIDEVAERLHILDLLDRRIDGLSGGEQQRVMLARALVGDPALILCDEPLAGLDPQLRARLLDQMRVVFQDARVPVLYVTHSIDEAVRLGDTLLVLRAGKIVDRGDAAGVLSRLADDIHYEAGVSSLLTGKVVAIDAEYGLARVAVGSGTIEVPAGNLAPGDTARLRLWAKDVVLALAVPTGISARNALAGTISELREIDPAQAEVTVMIGQTPVRTRVMRKTVAELGLAAGQPIQVIFKSVALE